jgi:hypothetical protein
MSAGVEMEKEEFEGFSVWSTVGAVEILKFFSSFPRKSRSDWKFRIEIPNSVAAEAKE